MATLTEYYEKDFGFCAKVRVKIVVDDEQVDSTICLDFSGYNSFLIINIPEKKKDFGFFMRLLSSLDRIVSTVSRNEVTLPIPSFPGEFKISNTGPLEIYSRFFGEKEWTSSHQLNTSKIVYVYSESQLTEYEMEKLRNHALSIGRDLRIRSNDFKSIRSQVEIPQAFICHDSRDKEVVAGVLAQGLQQLMCAVWYDEFSLNVGDNLKDKIEEGIKTCSKCILIISPSFIENKGWTKREFDSIFTRELLEKRDVILPVWYKVSQKDVYDYSPSLLNRVALDWEKLGEKEVARKLAGVILRD